MTKIYPLLPGQQDQPRRSASAFTYADLIIDYLSQIEVEYVFGIPGGAIEGLFDALARRSRGEVPESSMHLQRALERKSARALTGPSLVVTRHESGAAFMADGYARETGKLGVCCSTTGPGATNLLTGVANAYVDRVPMLVLTPQTALPSFGQRGFQESSSDLVDVVSMFAHCTRYSSLVSHPEQLEGKLCTALSTAFRRPRGPVHLSIPADILSLPVRSAAAQFNVATLLREPVAVDDASYQALLNAVEATRIKGRRIVIFMGEDCGEAAEEILRFADIVDAKVVSSPTGKRWISAGHPRYFGVFGFAGHDSARQALTHESVELVLAVGTSFGELDTAGWDSQALLNDRLVHIASSVSTFDRSPMAYLHVYGNLRALFTQLVGNLDSRFFAYRSRPPVAAPELVLMDVLLPSNIQLSEPEKCFSEELPIKPQRLMRELVALAPDDARFVIDTGNAWSWATHYMHLNTARRFHIAMGFGCMGWAIGASIGTALADKNRAVVCVTGDGSYLMSSQELTVAVEQQLPLCFIVLNDSALGMVKHGQLLNQAEPIGAKLPAVDFSAMANAQGARGFRIQCWQDLQDLDLPKLINSGGPLLLDVIIDGEEIPPMQSRTEVLRAAKHGAPQPEIEPFL
ncbi:MAG: thiamine pyrophosphate-binding protein [Pseudomonadales bacterium]|nr:MAG: thiamine pyrophosphate-binding protein [Pseudomonadales bacterium]